MKKGDIVNVKGAEGYNLPFSVVDTFVNELDPEDKLAMITWQDQRNGSISTQIVNQEVLEVVPKKEKQCLKKVI